MRDSFEDYVAASSGRLLRFAYVLCGVRFLAEDLVQDVLSRTHRHWRRIERENPDAYLRAALVRAHLSWRRRRVSTEKVLAEPSEGRPGTVRVHASRALGTLRAGLSRRLTQPQGDK